MTHLIRNYTVKRPHKTTLSILLYTFIIVYSQPIPSSLLSATYLFLRLVILAIACGSSWSYKRHKSCIRSLLPPLVAADTPCEHPLSPVELCQWYLCQRAFLQSLNLHRPCRRLCHRRHLLWSEQNRSINLSKNRSIYNTYRIIHPSSRSRFCTVRRLLAAPPRISSSLPVAAVNY